MGTGKIGNLWRARTHRRRTVFVTLVGLTVVAGALMFPLGAPAHDASDFFVFAKASFGSDRKSNETNCDSSNDKQADISGSKNTIHGRIHSNADVVASSGATNVFQHEITYGTHDEDCQEQSENTNTYNAGQPGDIDASPSGVNNGWPGDLNEYIVGGLTIDSIADALPGETCDVGSLSNGSTITLSAANNGQVICNGTGETKLDVNNQTMSLTILSHGPIVFSGQHNNISPAAHGILAFTDYQLDVAIKLAGSNFTVPQSAILFAPRGGIDTSGSDDSEMCIQLIGQGPIKVPGSKNIFGPGSAACTVQPPNVSVSKSPDGQTIPSGQAATFSMTVTNSGPGESTVTLTDNLPVGTGGLDWNEASDPSNACSVSTLPANPQVLSCNFGPVPSGQSRTVSVTTQTDAADCTTLNNTVNITATGDNSPSNNTDTGSITIQCPPGTVIVKKVMIGGTETFDFSGTPSGSISVNNGTLQSSVAPGNYSATEATEAGWTLTSITCDDSNSTVDLGTRTANFVVASGETVTCTFTNTKQAQVIVKKVMVGGTETFDFTGTPAGSIAQNNGTISANVAPGQHVVTETAEPGWALTDVDCDDTDSTDSLQDRQATFVVDAGEVVTCTFTNTKQAQVVVKKLMVGGTETFDFTGTPAGSISQNNGTISANVAPGQYLSTEALEPGWDLTDIDCDDDDSTDSLQDRRATFVVGAGEVVTCTFTNTKRGQVIVKKVMEGGTATFDFTGTPAGSIAQNNGTIQTTVVPGNYSSTEGVEAGWSLSAIDCDDDDSTGDLGNRTANFVVGAGEVVTCTFTNTKAAQVIVKKVMVGGTETFDFTGTPAGSISVNNGTLQTGVAPGQYLSTETAEAGWDLTSISCDDDDSTGSLQDRQATFNVAAGEVVTCTFTNTKQAKVIVKKVMVGGTADFGFSGTPSGSISTSNGTIEAMVAPGQHVSTEAAQDGWALTSVTCDDNDSTGSVDNRTATFNAAAGEIVTCTFTNTKQGKIVVVKQTIPDQDPATFGFTGEIVATLGDGQNAEKMVAPGPYSVVESAKAGWDLTSISCDDPTQNSSGSVGTRTASFNVAAGETVTCTFTNTKRATITVVKQTIPDQDPATFGFTGEIATTLGDGGSESTSVAAGEYSVTESAKAGWDLTSIVCEDTLGEGSSGDLGTRTASYDVDPGEDVTCTFTNTKRGQVIVEKVMVGGTATFGFTGTPAGSISQNEGTISQSVAPGQYVSTEGELAGWTLTGVSCDDLDSTGSVPNRQASFVVGPGEVVTCTFTNTKQAQVIVKKVMVGGADTFAFTGTPAGSIDSNNGTISETVAPGAYSSSEAAKDGWTLTSIECDDVQGQGSSGNVGTRTASFDVSPGEVVTCTFRNVKQAEIRIVKQTNPDGSQAAFDFSGEIVASLADGADASKAVAPGAYTVTEAIEAGWDLTSIVCDDTTGQDSSGNLDTRTASFDVSAGESVTCTFTNTERGTIRIEKQTNPDASLNEFGFTGEIATSLADGADATKSVAPGSYSVTEAIEAGWDLESITCDDPTQNSSGNVGTRSASFNVAAGETVSCVFLNEQDASIVVEKQTLPNGDPKEFDFTASYDANGFSLSDGEQNDSGDLDPGTYNVAETVPQGWDLESATCDDQSDPSSISLQAGETVTCTFVNEKDSVIIVEKVTNPHPDAQEFHFDASYDEGGFSLAGGQSNDSGDLDPGTYEIGEDVPEGWDLESIDCGEASVGQEEGSGLHVYLEAGETVTCTFTNVKRGTIVVEKQTSPNGSAGSFTYTGDAAGAISDNGQIVVANLEPGTYTSTEAAADGFLLTGISCDDGNSTGNVDTRTATFELEAGETVKCTFTNTKIVLGQGSIDVQKSADPTSIKEPGAPVNFTVSIQNTSNVVVTITSVVDNVFGDLDDSGGSGVFDVPITLAPGEKVSKTFQRQVNGTGGQAHVNVVTASGTDENGNGVSDSDDARVDITPRLIDLVIVKTATSPTPLNGIVNYTMTVTNKGPDTATNVQVADPAPTGISYLTVSSSKGTCNLTPSLITCGLGSLAAGETVTINVTARATAVGTHRNVATTTGGGGRETNPADNVDDAITVVPAPFIPPTKAKPKPKPQPVCLTLTVSPKMITADGKPDRVSVRVTAGSKRVKGTKVTIFGSGVRKTGRSNGKGMAIISVNPRKAGLITITAIETNQQVCGPKRIGVVGVFLPPLAG